MPPVLIDGRDAAKRDAIDPAGHADIGHDPHLGHGSAVLEQGMYQGVIDDNLMIGFNHKIADGVARDHRLLDLCADQLPCMREDLQD